MHADKEGGGGTKEDEGGGADVLWAAGEGGLGVFVRVGGGCGRVRAAEGGDVGVWARARGARGVLSAHQGTGHTRRGAAQRAAAAAWPAVLCARWRLMNGAAPAWATLPGPGTR